MNQAENAGSRIQELAQDMARQPINVKELTELQRERITK